ncbi:hypothetical protein UlMin_010319 [Ulmus minor]
MASTSSGSKTPLIVKEASSTIRPYPHPEATYTEVANNPILFAETLKKLHAFMGTKFMVPIIGGRELDLHRLFLEVTTRGGIDKILREKKWKQVTSVFNFPATATNATYVLRKYYNLLLYHYEQIYFFRARGWTSSSAGTDTSGRALSTPGSAPPAVSVELSPEVHAAMLQQALLSDPRSHAVSTPAPSSSAQPAVVGIIDGKIDSGYLVTVTIGSEKLKGVLYQTPKDASWQMRQAQYQQTMPLTFDFASAVPDAPQRRRRRKKCEIRRRDPAHPKPNRSGYNFFFAEQHARLKPLYPRRDREISRMIGELWNNIKEPEKQVYQELAVKDKERYRSEMENYRENLRAGQIISEAMPLQQRFPDPDVNMAEADTKPNEAEGRDWPDTSDNESTPTKSDSDSDEENQRMEMPTGVISNLTKPE